MNLSQVEHSRNEDLRTFILLAQETMAHLGHVRLLLRSLQEEACVQAPDHSFWMNPQYLEMGLSQNMAEFLKSLSLVSFSSFSTKLSVKICPVT